MAAFRLLGFLLPKRTNGSNSRTYSVSIGASPTSDGFECDSDGVDRARTPYGQLLEDARAMSRLSQRKAAQAAGISDGWWRQVVEGIQKRGSVKVPVSPSADVLVAMARAVGANVDDVLAAAGMQRPPAPPSLAPSEHANLLADLQRARGTIDRAIARSSICAATTSYPGEHRTPKTRRRWP